MSEKQIEQTLDQLNLAYEKPVMGIAELQKYTSNIQGKMLTLVETLFENKERTDAVKSIVKTLLSEYRKSTEEYLLGRVNGKDSYPNPLSK